MILAGKAICLLLFIFYSVPVIIGGAIRGSRVSDAQSVLWGIGAAGFITLQWLL